MTAPDDRRLRQIGERRIVSEILGPHYRDVPSFGDDCAAFGRDRVVTTDSCSQALVDRLGKPDWFHTGWLLATINLSDLAAAGAEPEGLVVGYTLPPDTPVSMLERLVAGVDACAARHGTVVRGGDIRDAPAMHLSATAVGRCPRRMSRQGVVPSRLSRRGAASGDRLVLVGSPGYLWASALLHHDHAVVSDEVEEVVFARAREPIAQLEAGRLLARRGLATAAIDVSDGLYASVRLLCEANRLGALMHPEMDLDPVVADIAEKAKISTFQLGQTWGDWCLLVAVRPRRLPGVLRMLRDHEIGAREIGYLLDDTTELRVDDGAGSRWDGLDQERFTDRSWHGDGIDEMIIRMRESSR